MATKHVRRADQFSQHPFNCLWLLQHCSTRNELLLLLLFWALFPIDSAYKWLYFPDLYLCHHCTKYKQQMQEKTLTVSLAKWQFIYSFQVLFPGRKRPARLGNAALWWSEQIEVYYKHANTSPLKYGRQLNTAAWLELRLEAVSAAARPPSLWKPIKTSGRNTPVPPLWRVSKAAKANDRKTKKNERPRSGLRVKKSLILPLTHPRQSSGTSRQWLEIARDQSTGRHISTLLKRINVKCWGQINGWTDSISIDMDLVFDITSASEWPMFISCACQSGRWKKPLPAAAAQGLWRTTPMKWQVRVNLLVQHWNTLDTPLTVDLFLSTAATCRPTSSSSSPPSDWKPPLSHPLACSETTVWRESTCVPGERRRGERKCEIAGGRELASKLRLPGYVAKRKHSVRRRAGPTF